MLNRLHNLPLSQIYKEQELKNILYLARQNGYPTTLIKKLNKNILNKKKTMRDNNKHTQDDNKTWVIFEYHHPIIRKITNIFKNSNL
jgi:hypothetical protein